jgi:hypothetical protein
MEVKNEYAVERKEQHDRTSQIDKTKVYMTKQALPIILEGYLEEPLDVRRRPQSLQNRPLTPHTQAGTSAMLQRDSRMTSRYTVKPVGLPQQVMNSQNLGPRERPGLHQTDPR